jgi:hypothetical protein
MINCKLIYACCAALSATVYVQYVVHSRTEPSHAQTPDYANTIPPRIPSLSPVQESKNAQSRATRQNLKSSKDKALYLLEELNSPQSTMAREQVVLKSFAGLDSTTLANHIADSSSEKELVTILQVFASVDAPRNTIAPSRILINRLATRSLNSALAVIGSSQNREFREVAIEEILPYLQVWDPEAAAKWSSAVYNSR